MPYTSPVDTPPASPPVNAPPAMGSESGAAGQPICAGDQLDGVIFCATDCALYCHDICHSIPSIDINEDAAQKCHHYSSNDVTHCCRKGV